MGGLAVIFPGQGSQAPEMGAPWKDRDGWWVVERASKVLGEDVADLLLSADPARLARTREAQIAVLVTSLVAWESRADGNDASSHGRPPSPARASLPLARSSRRRVALVATQPS